MHTVTPERLEQYFSVTKQALQMAQDAPVNNKSGSERVLDMAARYVSDAQHFAKQDNYVLAFAALNYAHGWLDCGASMNFFTVTDNTLFTVDGKD